MSARGAAASQPAYVLHHWDWSESSLIVDLFTRDAGRVAVAAKGAKRPTSNLRAVLLPFQRIQVAFARVRDETGASDVHNLRSAEWGGGAAVMVSEALLSGFYANELLMKLLARDDPHPALWRVYAELLPRLGGPDEAAALRAFELVLLAETGHLPDLARVTATLREVGDDAGYLLRPEAGLVEAARGDEAAVTGRQLQALAAALPRRDLAALVDACRPVEPALRRQLRGWLAYHLAGAPLRTREVVRDLQPLLMPR